MYGRNRASETEILSGCPENIYQSAEAMQADGGHCLSRAKSYGNS